MKIAVLLLLVVLSGCRKEVPAPSPERPAADLPMPRTSGEARVPEVNSAAISGGDSATMQTMRHLDGMGDAESLLAELRRREMVTPAQADFTPESAARKVRLVIGIEKSRIKAGQLPRFSLAMMNVGREAITYEEVRASLFVRGGSLLSTWVMHMYVTDPKGRRKELTPPTRPRKLSRNMKPAMPAGLSPVEMDKWAASFNAREEARSRFKIRLLPGEILHSIGDDDPPGEFKTLDTDDEFSIPGKYKLTLVLDDRPKPLTQQYIDSSLRSGESLEEIKRIHEQRSQAAIGPVSSNSVEFEVVE